MKAEKILAGRISDENGERVKNGSEFFFASFFFLHMKIDCGVSSLLQLRCLFFIVSRTAYSNTTLQNIHELLTLSQPA